MKRLSPRKQRIARLFDLVARPLWMLVRPLVAPARPRGDIRSILVVELWRLGDFALMTPALRALRERFPSARITVLGPAAGVELLRESGLIDDSVHAVLPWTAEEGKYDARRYDIDALRAIAKELRNRHFDLALSARMDLRDNVLMALSGAARRVGFRYGGGAFLLTDALEPTDGHRVDDWLALSTHVGARTADRSLVLRVSDREREWAAQWLRERGVVSGTPLVGIHPGAHRPVRRWSRERFSAVAERVRDSGARIAVFEDRDADAWPTGTLLPGTMPLREFMALLASCRLLVCNDSGPMHIAAALGIPTVSVFTSQRPEWYAPVGEHHVHAVVEGFACRPCWDECVFAEPYCNTALGVERVIPLVENALQRG